MYERFYNLRERPFSLSPDPDFLYPSRVHKEALGYLRYGIEGRAGFVVVTGEIGCGKTTLLQTLMRGLDRQTSVSRLVNTMLDARELIEAVMLDFGLDPPPDRSKPRLLRDLARYLVDQRNSGRLALLVIDEAQNLSLSALEEIRMLSNLETEKSKLIQIVLVGQPSLRDLLGRPELEQLRQRVTVSYHIQPLDADDTAAYINHRLRRAAIGTPMEFKPEVTALVYQHSGGVPRKINVIADAVLLFGYGEDQRMIDAGLTKEVVEELESTGVIAPPAAAPVCSAILAPPSASASQVASAPQVAPAPRIASAPQMVPAPQTAPAPSYFPISPAAPMPRSAQAAVPEAERQLKMQEAQIAARERQREEQHRIMREQDRLVRSLAAAPIEQIGAPAAPRGPTRQAPPAGTRSAETTPSPNVAASTPAGRPAALSRYYRPAQHLTVPESIWVRVRRTLFGAAGLLFED